MKKQSLKALSVALALAVSTGMTTLPVLADETAAAPANQTTAEQTKTVHITKENLKDVTGNIKNMTVDEGKAYIDTVDSADLPLLISGLIGEIYIHPATTPEAQDAQTAMTKNVGEIARYAYGKLTDDQKASIPEIPDVKGSDGSTYEYPGAGGADYFSTAAPIGSAEQDKAWTEGTVCTAPTKDKEILVTSFGTSYNTSRYQTIGAVERAMNKQYGNEYSVRRAFTSQIIINHILARDGYQIDTVRQALEKAQKAGVKEIIIQPTTLMSGEEYDLLKENVNQNKGDIKVTIATPLLHTSSDRKTVAKALASAAAKTAGVKTSALKKKGAKTAFVFIGHGTEHANRVTYTKMQKVYNQLGYRNVYIGTVEGLPKATSQKSLIKKLKKKGYKKVVIRGMMVVAGDHANNDIAGSDSDSWKSGLKKAGFKVSAQIAGLGSLKTVQNLYIQHTKAAIK